MLYESVRCNECGAVLQVPPSARYVTCNHCNIPLEVHRTSVATYTEAPIGPRPPAREYDPAWQEMAARLEALERQNELARIDREWDMERERFTQVPRYGGRRSVPSTSSSIALGVVFGTLGLGMIGFGLFLALQTQSPAGLACGLPGLIFLVVGALGGGIGYYQARQYERAYRDYQDRRAAVLGDLRRDRDEDY